MACIALPTPSLPTLPTGISIDPPPLPGIATPGLCCNFVPPWAPFIPNPLGALVATAPVLVALNGVIQGIQTWLDNLEPQCPRSA